MLSYRSQVFGLGQTIASTVAIVNGFGKDLSLVPDAQVPRVEKSLYAAEPLYIVTVALTKCSVALLFVRLMLLRPRVVTCYALLAASVLWSIGAFLGRAIECTSPRPWTLVEDRCRSSVSEQIIRRSKDEGL